MRLLYVFLLVFAFEGNGQVKWQNVDSLFGPLPSSFHVYRTEEPLEGKPNIAFYAVADLNDKNLVYLTDTTHRRRLKPQQFYEKNNHPLLVVNGTFFSFETNQNLNLVINRGRLLGYNVHSIAGRGKDTLTYRHPMHGAIGIDKKRRADVAWLYTDSTKKRAYALQSAYPFLQDSIADPDYKYFREKTSVVTTTHDGRRKPLLKKWKMETAIGGGPVLLQNGEPRITNNQEWKFAGKAISDKHPRTAMGYTADSKLVVLVVQGRTPGVAEGASLIQLAEMLKDVGCVEALNLDGGGSSCMLVNGKETINPSDAGGQRPVPAVFLIRQK